MTPASSSPARWDVRLREWIELGLGDWGRLVSRRPWPAIVAMLAVALALSSQLPRLIVETSVENFLLRGHPARVRYEEFRDRFGRDEFIILAVEPRDGRVFELAFLERLRALHEAIEAEVPHLDEVLSLINARETRGEGDELIVRELLEEWPEDEASLRRIEAQARANPLYRNLLLSKDGGLTTVLVRTSALSSAVREGADELGGFDDEATAEAAPGPAASRYLSGAENSEAVLALLDVVDRFTRDGLDVHVAGSPVMQHRLSAELTRNVTVFMTLSLLTVSALLLLLFRRLWAVVLPLVVVLLSIASTFGAMAMLGVAIGLPTQILPSFLLAVGVGGAVHLLTIFYQQLDGGAPRADALAGALEHAGLAIVMTALTTAGGLASFVTAEIEPVAALGWFAPLGVLLGLVYCLVLLPALLAVVPLRARVGKEDATSALDRALLWTGDQSVQRPWTVIACMSVVLLVSIAGITRLEFRYDPLSWFPEEEPLRVGTEIVDERLEGSFSLEFLVDGGREQALHEPRVLGFLDELADRTLAIEGVGGLRAGRTSSVADIVKEIHQALNEERPEFRRIPDDRRLVSQELLLFESSGSDDLEDFVDTTFREARFTILLPYSPPFSYLDFIERVEGEAERARGPALAALRFESTGVVALFAVAIRALLTSMLRSYGVALAIITPLMFLLLGNVRGGTAAMVPNIAPILVTLGFMGWAGIPLDVFTLLIGSIAIGLAVDDTIHFMHHFRKNYERNPDARDAVRQTLRTTGRALLTTSIVLSLAFFTYSFASLQNLALFGILTGFTIVVAFLADIGVSPALMELATRRERRRGRG